MSEVISQKYLSIYVVLEAIVTEKKLSGDVERM